MSNVTLPVMAELKSATHAQHDAVETIVNFNDAIHSLSSYLQLLEKFYGFYVPTEQQLSKIVGLEQVVPDIQSRMKSTLLRADLADLGGNASDVALSVGLPSLRSVPEALGCLYVLEGATLGGQILSRQAKDALNITPEHAGRFFSSYGNQVGAMWKRFSLNTNAYCELHPSERGVVVKSATETFLALSQWMQEPRNSDDHVS